VGCIVVDKFPRLEARFDPAENVSRGRLRFRPSGGAHWYSVPMKQEADAFVGVLPKPTKKLKSLDYYVEVTATDFATGRTEEYMPQVVSGLGACQDKIAAGTLGSASIILEVPPGAPAVPAGFSSTGIVGVTAGAGAAVGASGAAGGAVAGAAVAGAAAGGGHGAIIVLGIVGAGAAAAGAVAATRSEPERPPDPATLDNDGDGFTPQQGDCDDRDPALTPNTTGFDFVVEFGKTGIDVPATAPSTPTTVTLRNNSCSALTVERLNYTRVKSGPCGTSFNVNFDVAVGLIVPSRRTVTLYSEGAGGARCCCSSQSGCRPGLCVLQETFTLFSSAGSQSASNTYGFRDETCPFDAACPSSADPLIPALGCPPYFAAIPFR